jgi:hypothetical protein
MTFKVLKPFFKLSEQKNYLVDQTIELTKEDAEAMVKDGFLEEVKVKVKKEKND